VTFLYFQQYLSHRRDGSHFLKLSTWSTMFFRALRHSSNRVLEITHESWNLAMFRCANRLTGLPSGHQCLHIQSHMCTTYKYTHTDKNPSARNFLSPEPEVTCGTVAIIIRVVLLSPYLRIRGVSLSSSKYNQSHRVYMNRRQQYICLI
jgi:hypothetical protein